MRTQSTFPLNIARCALLCAAVLLAACSAISPTPRGAEVEDLIPGDPRQAYERGDYATAARLWQQEAIEAPASGASQLRLYAADAWLLAGDTDAAADLLPWIEQDQLAANDIALLNLLRAEVALDGNNPVEARHSLDQVGAALPPAYAARYQFVSGQVETALGTLGARKLQKAGELADELRGYDAEAALALMRELEQARSSQLARLATLAGDPLRAAWFDLALVLRQNLVDGQALERDVRAWEERHPSVEMDGDDALDLYLRYRQEFRPPGQVAVLLPQSGGLGAAGGAIRDGIMSAYLEQPWGSQIRFYDTGNLPESTLAAYFEAADDGAQWIIGPLDKASVEALLNLAGLATPVLALNDLPLAAGMPQGLAQQIYGMSLSAEHEAAAIARRMADLGYTHAVVLAPENTWGERIVSAFQANFLRDDREILTAVRYLPEENDHSQTLERALQIDQSKERRRQLENRLGMELEFEPIRRSDVDAIFLAASPQQGRALAPQLRFFGAGDIPTFTTSRVYTGQPDATRNQDLDGLNVPLTKWQIEHASPGSIPDLESLRGGEFAPLFAIGMDAWNVLPWLDLMRNDPDFHFPGQSGDYSFTRGGNLQREPGWGRFSGGRPIAVTAPPAAATTATTVEAR